MYLSPASSALLLPSQARAADLNTQERLDWIYDHRLRMDARGEGSLRIGLATGLSKVTLSSVRPLALGLSPYQGTRMQGGKRWTFEVHRGQAAQMRHSLELASIERGQRKTLQSLAKLWKDRGYQTRIEDQGALLGLSGRVLDGRRLKLLSGQFDSLHDAEKAAEHIARTHGQRVAVVSRNIQGPRGWIVAKDRTTRAQVKAQGALWVFSQNIPIEIEAQDEKGSRFLSRGRHFRGAIYVALDSKGKLCVVNEISESHALMGVVPAEIPANAPVSALRAQAIAARGQLFSKIGHRHHGDPFSLCADVHCQAYHGFAVEKPRTNAAIKATRGQLLMRPDARRLVDTVYSANSGGYSEHNEFVWPGQPDPQLRGTPDAKLPTRLPDAFTQGINASNLEAWLSQRPAAHCRPPKSSHNDVYRWQRNLDLRKLVADPGWPLPKGQVTALEVTHRGVSGRATEVMVTIDGRQHPLRGELRIRRALGALRSSMFLARVDGSILRVKGGGFGHGVGLCQYGAMGMAKAGVKHDAILAHYYRDSKLVSFW